MTPAQEQYNKERTEAYARMISLADRHISAIVPSLALNLDDMSDTAARQAAERDSWSLFRNGIRHLQEGGPAGQPGQFAPALSKTSLRASAAAQALGIPQPTFEGRPAIFDHISGDLEALFHTNRLIEAALVDAANSGQLIQNAASHATLPLHEPDTSVQDRELARIFQAVRKNAASASATADIDSLLQASVRKQAALTAQVQPEIYQSVGKKLQVEVMNLFVSPAPPRGPSFGR